MQFIILTSCSSAEEKKATKGLFWELKSEVSTVYLLGTVHVGKKDFYPLDEKIEKAFEKSDHLVAEIDISSVKPQDLQKYIKGDPSLYEGLNEKDSKKFKKVLSNLGIQFNQVQNIRPTYLSIEMTMMALSKLGYTPQYGIENYFFAKKGNRKTFGLEPLDVHFGFLTKLTKKEEHTMLMETIKSFDKLDKLFKDSWAAWKAGDIDKLEKLFIDEMKKQKSLYKLINVDRNKVMTEEINKLLKKRGTYFVMIGSAHFAGKDSIIEMLKRKGLKPIKK